MMHEHESSNEGKKQGAAKGKRYHVIGIVDGMASAAA